MYLRGELTKKFSWAIPNEEALKVLVEHGPVLEIGAGTGYWAALVAARGGDIIAYDKDPHVNDWCAGTYFPVRTGGPEIAQEYPHRTLFLCWPPYAEPMATDALLAYAGDTVIYVGEDGYGCTGDADFHVLLDEAYDVVRRVSIPRWNDIFDAMYVYRRRRVVR